MMLSAPRVLLRVGMEGRRGEGRGEEGVCSSCRKEGGKEGGTDHVTEESGRRRGSKEE